MNDHAPRTLQQRFHDHGRNLTAALRQQLFQLLHAFDVAGFALQTHWAAVAISRMHAMHWIAHGLERLRERRLVADGHGSRRVTMIAVCQRHDFTLLRPRQILEMLHRQLQRHFHCRRTIVGEKNDASALVEPICEVARPTLRRRPA